MIAMGLAACEPVGVDPSMEAGANASVTGESPADVKYFRSDEPMRVGIERFNEGNFGLAQRYFQDAVEKTPHNPSAWNALAASYDRLARFDLADNAYTSAVRFGGRSVQIINNEGYSHMLRGDLRTARAKFLQALRLDPTNQTVMNNLSLLDSSEKFMAP